MSTYSNGVQETYAHIAAAMHPAAFPTTPGTAWTWSCDHCGVLSICTFATQGEARMARVEHEAGCAIARYVHQRQTIDAQ